jgi:vacuolar protein sorting-associated protein 13A/C
MNSTNSPEQTSRGSRTVSLDVRAEGPTQTLCISNYQEEYSMYKPRRRPNSITGSLARSDTLSSLPQSEMFEAVSMPTSPTLSLTMSLSEIGLSLLNRRISEVAYFSMSGLKIEFTESEVARTLNVTVRDLQLDNQLHDASFAVVIQTTPVGGEAGDNVLPAVQASAIVLKDEG